MLAFGKLQSFVFQRDTQRETETERERDRDRDRETQRETQRDPQRDRDRERHTQRNARARTHTQKGAYLSFEFTRKQTPRGMGWQRDPPNAYFMFFFLREVEG